MSAMAGQIPGRSHECERTASPFRWRVSKNQDECANFNLDSKREVQERGCTGNPHFDTPYGMAAESGHSKESALTVEGILIQRPGSRDYALGPTVFEVGLAWTHLQLARHECPCPGRVGPGHSITRAVDGPAVH